MKIEDPKFRKKLTEEQKEERLARARENKRSYTERNPAYAKRNRDMSKARSLALRILSDRYRKEYEQIFEDCKRKAGLIE